MTTAHLNPFEAVAAMPRRPSSSPAPTMTQDTDTGIVDAEVTAADLATAAPAAAPISLKKDKKAMPQRANHVHPELDLDKLQVMTGVKMGTRAPKQSEKWGKLFDVKLAEVGNAIYVPAIYGGGISAAALKRTKAALAAGKKDGEFPRYKVARAGIAKNVPGIPDGTPISMVGRVA